MASRPPPLNLSHTLMKIGRAIGTWSRRSGQYWCVGAGAKQRTIAMMPTMNENKLLSPSPSRFTLSSSATKRKARRLSWAKQVGYRVSEQASNEIS